MTWLHILYISLLVTSSFIACYSLFRAPYFKEYSLLCYCNCVFHSYCVFDHLKRACVWSHAPSCVWCHFFHITNLVCFGRSSIEMVTWLRRNATILLVIWRHVVRCAPFTRSVILVAEQWMERSRKTGCGSLYLQTKRLLSCLCSLWASAVKTSCKGMTLWDMITMSWS